MVPSIQCKSFSLTDAIRQAVLEKADKILQRADATSLTVTLDKESELLYRVHFELRTADEGLFNATAKGGDLYATVHEASDKILRQMKSVNGRHSRTRIASQLLPDEEAPTANPAY